VKKMRRNRLFWILVVSAVMVPLFLSACGTSRQARFYTLNSVQSLPATGKQTSVAEGPVRVGVGPIEIPDYLDRPQVVMRASENEITVSEFDRWGGPLRRDIPRVVLEDLSVLLAPSQVSVVPWTHGGILNCRVAVDVIRFDTTPGKEVWLRAKWTVFGQDGKTVAMVRESNIREPLGSKDVSNIVAAMSQAVGKLSQEMASGIASVLSAKPKGG
jgi:uncharacterized lipoprotein YmbA